jgi:lysophospholipase L1-like esterase
MFCGVIVLFASVLTHAATEPSLWIRNGSPTRTLLEDNLVMTPGLRNPECINMSVDVLDKIVAGTPLNPVSQPVYYQISNSCWRVQSGGMYADNGVGTIQLNGMGSMMRLGDAYYSYTFAGDKILKWGGGPIAYFSAMRVITSPLEAAVVPSKLNVPYSITFADKSSNWQLMDPGTTNPMYVKNRDISPNGMWLVVESTWGLVRVNLDTHEMIPFDTATGVSYNTYGFTVSNDGRYVIVMEAGSARIYDLSTCNMTGISGRKIATGCGKRDLGKDLKPTNVTTEISTIRFNALGDGFTYLAKENNVWKRYSVTAPGQAEHGIDYLALGDSYVSGEGDGDGGTYYLPGTDGDGARTPLFLTGIDNYPYDKEKCHLSSRSYPFLIANSAGLHADEFRSVACSGADANDVGNTLPDNDEETRLNGHFDNLKQLSLTQVLGVKKQAIDNFIPGRAAQIEFVSRYKPKVLTIGLSGNDINFGGKLTECITSLDTCRYAESDAPELVRELKDNVYTRFGDLLRRIKSASPTTRIYVIGYPQLVGEGACNSNVLLDSKEQAYVRAALSYLNDTLEATASSAGVNYIDIEHALDGVNLCSDQKYPMINGLTGGDDIYNIFGSESYHPNEAGHKLIAATIEGIMGDVSIVDYQPCGNPMILQCNTASTQFPTPPVFFRSGSDAPTTTAGTQRSRLLASNDTSVVVAGDSLEITSDNLTSALAPNTNVAVILKSTPVNLSPSRQLVTDASGNLTTTVTIPADTQPGVHTLHIVGTRRSGEQPIDLYQSIVVAADADDYDGDGISNADDTCQFVAPSGIDSDNDDIDDACEGDLRPHTKPASPTGGTDPVRESTSGVLGAGTVVAGAVTPYKGPVAQLTTAQGGAEETVPGQATAEHEIALSPDVDSRDADAATDQDQMQPYIWYSAGGIVILATIGVIIYRLRR